MVKITVADTAWNDIESIVDYIASDSPRYANEFVEKLFERINILYEFYESGRIVPEFTRENLRELIYGKYRVVYLIESPEMIIILRIIHGSKILSL